MKNLLIIFVSFMLCAFSCTKNSMVVLNSNIQPTCNGQVLGDSITVVILTKMNPTEQNVGVVIRSMWDSIPCNVDRVDFCFDNPNQSNDYSTLSTNGELIQNRIFFRTTININQSNAMPRDTLFYTLKFYDSNNGLIRSYPKFHIVEE